ncbi:MAG: hypothetical protein A2X35_02105 [Elusimicrobia bacterium GWA2_61_42]|nr:MAG: hypothetical protein A2X35_02105 [Elusimicrobia bacterium GWA2_61_42]OGR79848.1 MAG: hypothetical protein A2X38_12120 [Elusimicrobia bacterium GWC2_61_25]
MGKKPLRILAIDDNLNCLRVAAKYLTLVGGHLVDVASSGTEGLKKAFELRPDLILLDMIMPDMNGLEVMDGLYTNADTREIPVIVVTGARVSESDYAVLKAKTNFMQLEEKPADFKKLLKTIEIII